MKVKIRTKLRNAWKKEFERRGLVYCEIQLPNCWGIVQGFAHAKKSRELKPEEYNKVVAGCTPCHRQMDEDMTHEEMESMVDLIILSSDWATRTEDLNLITKGWKLQ